VKRFALPPPSRHAIVRTLLGLAFAPLVALHAAPASAAPADEAVVAAAFILNFAKFTEWPVAAAPVRSGSFQLCAQGGREDLLQSLHALEGRQVHGQAVAFRKLARGDDAKTCHVLVVSDGPIPTGLASAPVLVVGDQPGFALAGGHIGLVRSGAKLRFEVNRMTVAQAGLKLSSQLLSLAATVLDGSAAKE